MAIQLPESVNDIINQLMDHGFEAYAVGGCIRDSILGTQPEDWDITTSAKPKDVKRIFQRTVDTGIKHGTVTVLHDKGDYEVTTYRIDGEYEGNRHPKSVEFTSDLAKDLKRRDFTINAMAYNDKDGLIDLYGGIRDLENKLIKCVGNPIDRFEEDALRILRAFRFCAQLNFSIEENTYKAAYKKKENLKNISAERIRSELNKLLLSDHPEKLLELYNASITDIIFPEFDSMVETPHYELADETVASFAIKTLQKHIKFKQEEISIKNDLVIRWTLLLHEANLKNKSIESFELSKKILRRLKFDNETIKKTSLLIKYIHIPFILSEYEIRKAINQIGYNQMQLLFYVKTVRLKTFDNQIYKVKLKDLSKAYRIYNEIDKRGDCTSLSSLKVDGKDLIELGYKPGKALGQTLNLLLDMVLQDPSKNNKAILLKKAEKYLEKTK